MHWPVKLMESCDIKMDVITIIIQCTCWKSYCKITADPGARNSYDICSPQITQSTRQETGGLNRPPEEQTALHKVDCKLLCDWTVCDATGPQHIWTRKNKKTTTLNTSMIVACSSLVTTLLVKTLRKITTGKKKNSPSPCVKSIPRNKLK